MLDRNNFRGIYVIVVTPFTEDFEVDEAALSATLDFCLDAGVHGLVAPAIASEVSYLSEQERRRVASIVVEKAKGRVPTVIGVSSPHYRLSIAHAEFAAEIGADAILATPPNFHPPSPAEVRGFYRELGAATPLPVIIQNAFGPGATPMSAAVLTQIMNEVPTARFVKEETQFPAQMTGEIIAAAGDRLLGVMGGRAGRAFMEEYRHGSSGTMPACEIADVHVALWNALEAGEDAKAREIFRRLLPLLDFEQSYGMAMCKEVLRVRGVIPNATWRQTGCRPLDTHAKAELAQILDDLREYMHPDHLPRA